MRMSRATCRPCGYTFDLAAAPANLTTFARAMMRRALCPLCLNAHGKSGVVMAEPRDLTPDEIASKTRDDVRAMSSDEVAR